MTNHYLDILGLRPGASEREIKAKYRKLAKVYHPDVNKSPEAKQKFIEIHEAYKFLTDVGPTPNNEPVSYDFDPRQRAYDEWRQRAKAYAREKAREAEREQRIILYNIYTWFNYLAVLVIIFNGVLLTDYYLPEDRLQQRIIAIYQVLETGNNRVVHRYDDILFENLRLRVKKEEGLKLEGISKAEIAFTPLLNTLKHADFQAQDEWIRVAPAYDIYKIFRYLIPIVLLFNLGYFYINKTDQNKLTFLIAILFAMACQIYLFFRFGAVNDIPL